MLKTILFSVFAIIAVAGVLGFTLPDRVHVERSVRISAPPETVFALISDFKAWDRWSPWAALDPNAEYSFSGDGVGQKMSWRSDTREVGDGSQEITVLEAPTKMVTALDFGDMGGGFATFDVAATETGSEVKWSMDTNMREGVPVPMKPVATFLGFFMDGMIGGTYENGLASLKREAEKDAASLNAAE
ncbi:MAG: SRPBCC family protein [Pseudomonadota bacterium]